MSVCEGDDKNVHEPKNPIKTINILQRFIYTIFNYLDKVKYVVSVVRGALPTTWMLLRYMIIPKIECSWFKVGILSKIRVFLLFQTKPKSNHASFNLWKENERILCTFWMVLIICRRFWDQTFLWLFSCPIKANVFAQTPSWGEWKEGRKNI